LSFSRLCLCVGDYIISYSLSLVLCLCAMVSLSCGLVCVSVSVSPAVSVSLRLCRLVFFLSPFLPQNVFVKRHSAEDVFCCPVGM